MPIIRSILLAILLSACISSTRQIQASSRVELGTAYLVEGNAPGAVETLREATELDPRNWNAWNKLALATMSLGALDQAEEAFLKSIDLVPEKAEVRNNYGTMLLHQGRHDEAVEQFEVALRDLTYRKPALVMNNMGSAYTALGNHEKAIYWLDQSITRAPNLCQARFNRGVALRALGKGPKALDDFETVIQLCGSDALGAYYQAGLILMEMDDRQTGCHYIRKVAAEAAETPLGREASDFAAREC